MGFTTFPVYFSRVQGAGIRAERSKSSSCRVRCLAGPKANFGSCFRLAVPEGTRGELQELSVRTEFAPSEDVASSSVDLVSDPEGPNPTLLPPTARKRPANAPTAGASKPEGSSSPIRHVWIVNHSQWCVHPSKLSPQLQLTPGHCMVRKPHDHPVVMPSRRCSQASLPLLSPLPKKLCHQWSMFPNSRPQGFDPASSPLHWLRVASQPMPDAPLGFCSFVRRLVPGFRSNTRVMVRNLCQLHRPHDPVPARLPKAADRLCIGVASSSAEAKNTRASSRSRPRGLPLQPQTPLRVNSNRCRWPM